MLADAWDRSDAGLTTETAALREATSAQVDLSLLGIEKPEWYRGSQYWSDSHTVTGACPGNALRDTVLTVMCSVFRVPCPTQRT